MCSRLAPVGFLPTLNDGQILKMIQHSEREGRARVMGRYMWVQDAYRIFGRGSRVGETNHGNPCHVCDRCPKLFSETIGEKMVKCRTGKVKVRNIRSPFIYAKSSWPTMHASPVKFIEL